MKKQHPYGMLAWTAGAVMIVLVACGAGHPARRGQTRWQAGLAGYYSDALHGFETANGERYDRDKLTAAHKTLPFGAVVQVTNLQNGKSVAVCINDRGPFVKGRIIDLSFAAAQKIEMLDAGVVKVSLQVVD